MAEYNHSEKHWDCICNKFVIIIKSIHLSCRFLSHQSTSQYVFTHYGCARQETGGTIIPDSRLYGMFSYCCTDVFLANVRCRDARCIDSYFKLKFTSPLTGIYKLTYYTGIVMSEFKTILFLCLLMIDSRALMCSCLKYGYIIKCF